MKESINKMVTLLSEKLGQMKDIKYVKIINQYDDFLRIKKL